MHVAVQWPVPYLAGVGSAAAALKNACHTPDIKVACLPCLQGPCHTCTVPFPCPLHTPSLLPCTGWCLVPLHCAATAPAARLSCLAPVLPAGTGCVVHLGISIHSTARPDGPYRCHFTLARLPQFPAAGCTNTRPAPAPGCTVFKFSISRLHPVQRHCKPVHSVPAPAPACMALCKGSQVPAQQA